jgi:hypothetical protein
VNEAAAKDVARGAKLEVEYPGARAVGCRVQSALLVWLDARDLLSHFHQQAVSQTFAAAGFTVNLSATLLPSPLVQSISRSASNHRPSKSLLSEGEPLPPEALE